MSELLQKNDIIRTPRGLLAYVKSYNFETQMISCSLVAGERGDQWTTMQYKLDEVMVVKRGSENFFEDMFRKMNDEELRNAIREDRAKRQIIPTVEEKKVRAKDNITELLGELSEEEKKELVGMVREKKDKSNNG
jgi:hypothetical protein